MSEAVAKVMKDIITGRAIMPPASMRHPEYTDELVSTYHTGLIDLAKFAHCMKVDSTPMYRQIVEGGGVDLYSHYRIMPVWQLALIGYENQWGNVYVIQTYCADKERVDEATPNRHWHTVNDVDWDKVTHYADASLWMGGIGQGQPVPTVGPVHRWDAAMYEDGSLADLHWTEFTKRHADDKEDRFQNPMLVWLQTVTLATCVNVELYEPQRPRAERRRLDRIGISPKTIRIMPTSRSGRSGARSPGTGEVPQSFVRGHYAEYGTRGRGLLFGKYSGRFWIPAHARGTVEREQRDIDYQAG